LSDAAGLLVPLVTGVVLVLKTDPGFDGRGRSGKAPAVFFMA